MNQSCVRALLSFALLFSLENISSVSIYVDSQKMPGIESESASTCAETSLTDSTSSQTQGIQHRNKKKVGYVYEERYMWHSPWVVSYTPLLQPFQHWENPETKRRLHNLLLVSNLYDEMIHLRPAQPASKEIIGLVHTPEYVSSIEQKSLRIEGGYADDETTFSQYAFDIASLAVGGTILAVDSVMKKRVQSAYVLARPPGHHALPHQGMGFCIFNNVAIAARYLINEYPEEIKKVAIVDYDVHHGNGSQDIFYNDPSVLFISIHQDSNYPAKSGGLHETGGDSAGGGSGIGSTINIPLPPGSGMGAYKCAFDTIVIPSLLRFQPDFILVSSGFDASYADPLSAMMLSSEDFRSMASSLVSVAGEVRNCKDRIVFVHEGGYSESYVPFCGAAVIEAMIGIGKDGNTEKKVIEDPFLDEVNAWAGQDLQMHQYQVIDQVAVLHNLSRPIQPSQITK